MEPLKFDMVDEYEKFLTNQFATNKNKWEKYVSFLATLFLKSFYKNLLFMEQQIDNLIKMQNENDPLLNDQYWKLEKIKSILLLKDSIIVDKENDEIRADIKKISEEFIEITNKDNINEINFILDKMENENLTTFNNSFKELDYYFNYLITYINEEKFRKTFYYENLLQEEKGIISGYISNEINFYSKTN